MQIRCRISNTNTNLCFVAAPLLIAVIILSPFIEQQRWPFSAWFSVISKAEYDALRTKLTEANNEIIFREQHRALVEHKIIIIQQEVEALRAKIIAYEQKLGASPPAK